MKLLLTGIKDESPNTKTFVFQPDQPVTWKAGQFIKYIIEDPNPDNRKTQRFFSISSAPYEKNIHLTTKFVPCDGSTFKKDLQKFKVGDTVDATIPEGDFILEGPSKEYAFIAGGIGITPLHSIIKDLDHSQKPVNITLLYANRTLEVVFKKDLEDIAKRHPEFKIHYVIDPQRIDEQLIKEKVPDFDKKIFYVSGPEPMVELFEKMLADMGIPEDNIKRDYFPGYEWP